jgi:hypothetical protein
VFINAVAGRLARTPGNACLSSWTTGQHDDGETIALKSRCVHVVTEGIPG